MDFNCSMCPFFSVQHEQLLLHVIKRHRLSTSFMAHCNIPGCGASYKNYLSFKKHVYRKLRYVTRNGIENNSQLVVDDDMIVILGGQKLPIMTVVNVEAVFVLQLKVCHNVTDNACSDIMDSVKNCAK